MAINPDGTLDDFEWRISSAAVVDDGEFSDFSGYHRDLILLQGKGVILKHDQAPTDRLDKFLAKALFNGSNKTNGELLDGPIVDLNLITNSSKYNTEVEVFDYNRSMELKANVLYFFYSPNSETRFENIKNHNELILPTNHLMQCFETNIRYSISASSLIVMILKPL